MNELFGYWLIFSPWWVLDYPLYLCGLKETEAKNYNSRNRNGINKTKRLPPLPPPPPQKKKKTYSYFSVDLWSSLLTNQRLKGRKNTTNNAAILCGAACVWDAMNEACVTRKKQSPRQI